MQIIITGNHIEITESLRNYINSKFDKLDKYSDFTTKIHVTLKPEKINHIAEATASILGADGLHAKAEKEDMYTAIDDLVDKLNHRLSKYKEKLKQH